MSFPIVMREAARIAETKAARRRSAIADAADALPGLRAHVEGDSVVIEGRNLLERWLRDADLRDIGRTGA